LYELCAYKHDSEAEKKNTKSGEQKWKKKCEAMLVPGHGVL
jgi:hypothetical protein